MRYGSVCSGIEAATAAWHPLGWRPAFFSEIEKFPSAMLAHHYPDVPNLGDMTKFKEWPDADIDVLVGGTPCQSFSVAGLRKGLDDPRGNLMLTYLAIAERYRPRWVVWENVPGVLSSNGGRDFGTFLGALGELGYGFAYRVLDAQYFGVAQRRRRVFVVGCLGDWRAAAAVLFERQSLRGDLAPSREKRQAVAALTANGVGTCGADDNQGQGGHLVAAYGGGNCSGSIDASTALTAHGIRQDFDTETFITHTLRGEGFDASEDGTGRCIPLVPTEPAIRCGGGGGDKPHVLTETADCLTSHWHNSNGAKAGNNAGIINPVINHMSVRRLTPRECERLQGFADDYTRIPWRGKSAEACPDGPRYKAIGNSMAVPVMAWIGERIELVDAILNESKAAA